MDRRELKLEAEASGRKMLNCVQRMIESDLLNGEVTELRDAHSYLLRSFQCLLDETPPEVKTP